MSIITLVGIMGCGKSTIGKELAIVLNKKHFDTDQTIEKILPIKKIFEGKGEKYFRALEYETIDNLLNTQEDCIISIGGGAFIEGPIRQLLLQKTITVWLKVHLHTILSRVKKDNGRPLMHLLNKKFFDCRNNIYKEALIHIECDNLTPSAIVQKLTTQIKIHCISSIDPLPMLVWVCTSSFIYLTSDMIL